MEKKTTYTIEHSETSEHEARELKANLHDQYGPEADIIQYACTHGVHVQVTEHL